MRRSARATGRDELHTRRRGPGTGPAGGRRRRGGSGVGADQGSGGGTRRASPWSPKRWSTRTTITVKWSCICEWTGSGHRTAAA